MKLKCPTCQTDLRYIASSNYFLCNDCGFTIQGTPTPIAASPKPKTNPIFQKYKPWQTNPYRFAFLGLSLFAIAAIGIGIKQYQDYLISKRIDAAIADSQKLIEEVKASQINIKDLPQVCQPRPHIHLSYKMFTDCFVEGVTYRNVATMIGTTGRLASKSGPMSIYQWGDPTYGMVTISFVEGQLSSKNQVNLETVTLGDDEAPE
jgi:Tfp pilus assembly major pilin PilA